MEKLGHERLQILQSVRARSEDDDGDIETDDMLLKREVAIDRDQHIKERLGFAKQSAILQSRPPHAGHGCDLMVGEMFGEAPINALVQKHFTCGQPRGY